MTMSRTVRFATVFAGLFLALSLVATDYAEARRGGSFGSRGMRTFQAAPPTRTAPRQTAPVERSMTPNTGQNNAVRQTQPATTRPGFANGFGGSMLRGLMLGGLIGLLLGHGLGGLAGMFGMLLQLLLIGGLIFLLVRMFRPQLVRGPEPAMAGGPSGNGDFSRRDAAPREERHDRPSGYNGSVRQSTDGLGHTDFDEIGLRQDDLDTFERRLTEVQEAFAREDHAALRRLVTPEIVSYLSEELAENAKNGLRNDVSHVRLLQADIAESWREGETDYATAAMRYSSVDVMRERTSDRIVKGDAERPTETTELWTFTRQNGGDWKVSAIQEV